jgi:fluoride ion exporter CrcB/FEX
MENQHVPGKNYTLGALLLQVLALLMLATSFFAYSLSHPVPSTALSPFIIFGVLGAITIGLTFMHNTKTVRKQTLQRWASLHIAITIFMILTTSQTMGLGIQVPFAMILQIYFYPIPPLLVHVFAGRERT